MPGPDWIVSTKVSDGKGGKRDVSVGDRVDLIPLSPEQAKKWNAETNFRLLQGHLGDPPYTINHIGEWPCGGITIYVKSPNGESGVEAKKFMAA